MPAADSTRTVKAFFYGSFIREDVQRKSEFHPTSIEMARLSGFDIRISPHAALFRSDRASVYGVLVDITHRQLDTMYAQPGVGIFLPEAVLVETQGGQLSPALCYIPPAPDDKPADRDYLAKLIAAGRGHGFPDWYLAHLGAMP